MGNELQRRSVSDIVDELIKREGVQKLTVAPHSLAEIHVNKNWEGKIDGAEIIGSAIILIITD